MMPTKYLSTKAGTFGGTIAATVPSIDGESFLTSAVLAVFGATISFLVSLLLKVYLKDHIKKKLPRKRKRK